MLEMAKSMAGNRRYVSFNETTRVRSPNFQKIMEGLISKYGGTVRDKIRKYEKQKEMLGSRRGNELVLREVVNSIFIAGFRGKRVKEIVEKIENDSKFGGWNPRFLSSMDGGRLLKKHFKNERKITKVQKLCESIIQKFDGSPHEWLKYILEKDPRTLVKDKRNKWMSLGRKSNDDFLVQFGFFKRLPVDTLVERFMIVTGLIHFGIKKSGLTYSRNYFTLRKIAYSTYGSLGETEFAGYKLNENPGIVDRFIWTHCNDEHGCCLIEPRCNNCPKQTRMECFYYRNLNAEK